MVKKQPLPIGNLSSRHTWLIFTMALTEKCKLGLFRLIMGLIHPIIPHLLEKRLKDEPALITSRSIPLDRQFLIIHLFASI